MVVVVSDGPVRAVVGVVVVVVVVVVVDWAAVVVGVIAARSPAQLTFCGQSHCKFSGLNRRPVEHAFFQAIFA